MSNKEIKITWAVFVTLRLWSAAGWILKLVYYLTEELRLRWQKSGPVTCQKGQYYLTFSLWNFIIRGFYAGKYERNLGFSYAVIDYELVFLTGRCLVSVCRQFFKNCFLQTNYVAASSNQTLCHLNWKSEFSPVFCVDSVRHLFASELLTFPFWQPTISRQHLGRL